MRARRGNPRTQCSICPHVERARAELLLARGDQVRATARKFGMSEDALARHWRNHVSEEQRAGLVLGGQALAAQQSLAVQVAEANGSVLDNYLATRSALWTRLVVELSGGHSTVAAILATQITRVNDSIARLTGELAASPLIQQTNIHVNLTQHPDFLELMQDLAEALGPYPEARRAVFARIEQREVAPDDEAEPLPRLEHHDEQPHEAAEAAETAAAT
jgi:transposase-like protein